MKTAHTQERPHHNGGAFFSSHYSFAQFTVIPKKCLLLHPKLKCIKQKRKNSKPMKIIVPIGQLIREELRKQNKTNGWLAERINVNVRTINKIFLKNVIDTQQLHLISKALEVDFFKMFSDTLPWNVKKEENENTSTQE